MATDHELARLPGRKDMLRYTAVSSNVDARVCRSWQAQHLYSVLLPSASPAIHHLQEWPLTHTCHRSRRLGMAIPGWRLRTSHHIVGCAAKGCAAAGPSRRLPTARCRLQGS